MEVTPRRRLRGLQRHVAAPERAAKDSGALTPVEADTGGFVVSEAERETIEAHRYLFDLQGVRALLWRPSTARRCACTCCQSCLCFVANACSAACVLCTDAGATRARSTSSSRTC